jgi:hypothetical protein
MSERTERAVLNHLIETCRDAERGFTIAAHEVRAREKKTRTCEGDRLELRQLGVEDRRAPARLLPWGDLPGLPSPLLQPIDPRPAHEIFLGDLVGWHPCITVAQDPDPQIHGVRGQE